MNSTLDILFTIIKIGAVVLGTLFAALVYHTQRNGKDDDSLTELIKYTEEISRMYPSCREEPSPNESGSH